MISHVYSAACNFCTVHNSTLHKSKKNLQIPHLPHSKNSFTTNHEEIERPNLQTQAQKYQTDQPYNQPTQTDHKLTQCITNQQPQRPKAPANPPLKGAFQKAPPGPHRSPQHHVLCGVPPRYSLPRFGPFRCLGTAKRKSWWGKE